MLSLCDGSFDNVVSLCLIKWRGDASDICIVCFYEFRIKEKKTRKKFRARFHAPQRARKQRARAPRKRREHYNALLAAKIKLKFVRNNSQEELGVNYFPSQTTNNLAKDGPTNNYILIDFLNAKVVY